MTSILPSYLSDAWWTPPSGSAGTLVRDASTGEPVASLSSEGWDATATVTHARTVGRSSLAALSFHQRALILKQLGTVLNEHRDALAELSMHAGSTARDAAADIDGGIGVLFSYSSKGRREMPGGTIYLDGPAESLSKDGSFLGRHIYTSLPGVAVQINAFNFPTWGALEKFAPAFLAGVPTIVKPATTTAYIAEAWMRILADSGLLPAGSLQLVCGRADGLLDELGLGDHVGFTGSAATSAIVGAHPAFHERGARLTRETDSINASVLGPDAAAGTPEFEAFVRGLFAELTGKAGQKCTAIRRAIVPEASIDDVVAAVAETIAQRTVLGDPHAEGVTLGPLVSTAQRDDVLAQVARLTAAGGRIVLGSPDAPEVRRADGSTGPAPNGAFVTPMLLVFDDNQADAAHQIEAFGPVASVLGYSSPAEVAALVARGGGSLVTSVASRDPEFVRTLVTAIAPLNGRVLMLDRDDARTSTGHGAPLPQLVHGGPGRAGGGEELGGIRAVLHYMQRTALQGTPAQLTAMTGVWHPGAATREDVHPFRKSLAELRVGDRFVSPARAVTLADIEHFAEFTGDNFYAHMDEEAAAANPFFPGRVAHGYLLVSWAAGLFVDPDPGPVLTNYGLEGLRFITPVSPDDEVKVVLTAKQIIPREGDAYGEVRWDAVLTNQREQLVASYDVLTLVAKQWPPSAP